MYFIFFSIFNFLTGPWIPAANNEFSLSRPWPARPSYHNHHIWWSRKNGVRQEMEQSQTSVKEGRLHPRFGQLSLIPLIVYTWGSFSNILLKSCYFWLLKLRKVFDLEKPELRTWLETVIF